jgi:hypothetical protein
MLAFKRRKFDESYSELDKAETLKEVLFLQKMHHDHLVLIRKNLGKLDWLLVILVLPIILGILSTL